MKISINRNILWAEIFVESLAGLGVKYACVSPGSRNTPLSFAFASNKKIKTFVIVDERSSAFFASGLSRKTNSPVAIVTTSGTAVAELYPAIIESYYQRIPLIVCTADRPSKLRDSGANQTINQRNIYKNHIRFFADAGMPAPSLKRIKEFHKIISAAVNASIRINRGPVHINLPFEKPFEPKSHTDLISSSLIEKMFAHSLHSLNKNRPVPATTLNQIEKISKTFLKKKKGFIVVGMGSFDKKSADSLIKLASKLNFPIYADGASRLRYYSKSKKNLRNLTATARAKNFLKLLDPEIILQFGAAPTSNQVLDFLKYSKAEKILINEWGDFADPSLTFNTLIKIKPSAFCEHLIKKNEKANSTGNWQRTLKSVDGLADTIKKKMIMNSSFPFEGRIVTELLESLPDESNLFISNSSPIRDADFFAHYSNKNINIYSNRGASGIDGINSSAAGISAVSNGKPTVLLIGDLAFYHDLNGLYTVIKYKIPLTIILVNNKGGGIFEMLPVSDYGKIFSENFTTPVYADFEKIVSGYGGKFYKVNSWQNLKSRLSKSISSGNLNVLEIETDSKNSFALRKNYWDDVSSKIEKYLNENKN